MNTSIHCTIANQKVVINNNAVKVASPSLQIELVKRLIECKSQVSYRESALPLFYNKFLRHYPISEIKFIDNKSSNNFIESENWGMIGGVAA
ncbi:MAG: hypothetical protein ACJA0Q_001644 [Saprospiraceae bacterium]|jgi:hypothetical protein